MQCSFCLASYFQLTVQLFGIYIVYKNMHWSPLPTGVYFTFSQNLGQAPAPFVKIVVVCVWGGGEVGAGYTLNSTVRGITVRTYWQATLTHINPAAKRQPYNCGTSKKRCPSDLATAILYTVSRTDETSTITWTSATLDVAACGIEKPSTMLSTMSTLVGFAKQGSSYHLPPSSRVTGVKCCAAAFIMIRPTEVQPV